MLEKPQKILKYFFRPDYRGYLRDDNEYLSDNEYLRIGKNLPDDEKTRGGEYIYGYEKNTLKNKRAFLRRKNTADFRRRHKSIIYKEHI